VKREGVLLDRKEKLEASGGLRVHFHDDHRHNKVAPRLPDDRQTVGEVVRTEGTSPPEERTRRGRKRKQHSGERRDRNKRDLRSQIRKDPGSFRSFYCLLG